MSVNDPSETCDDLIFQLAEHRDNSLNLVLRRGHQTLVARQTLRGGLPNDLQPGVLLILERRWVGEGWRGPRPWRRFFPFVNATRRSVPF